MTAAVENGSLKPEDLTLEDCKYVLRALEREAFKGVLYALRAQGPLSQYKEVLLDHLKAVFFMDEDDYLAQVRMATNHPLLSKICSELNPSYDNYAEWATAAFSLADFDTAADSTVTSSPLLAKCASSMFRAIDHFNNQVDEEHTNMLKLLQLPKRPYVPERLRRLLQDSEKDVNGRVDVIRERKEKAIRKLPIKRHVGRPRKNEVRPIVKPGRKPKRTKEEKAAERVHKRPRGRPPSVNPAVVKTVRDAIAAATAAAAKEAEDAAAKAAPAPAHVQNGVVEQNGDVAKKPEEANVPSSTVASPPKEVEASPYTDAAQSTVENLQPTEAATTAGAGGSSSADELPDSTSGDVEGDDGKSERGRKRKSFLKDPFTSMASQRRKSGDDQCDCARVRPFIFDKPEPGQRNKPIRGNPDKRAIKRSGSMSYPYSAAAVHSQPAEGAAGPSTAPPTAPGPAPAPLPLPAHNPHGFTVKQVAYAGPLGAGIGSDVAPVRQHLVVPVTGNTYIARSIPQLKKTYARSTVTGHRYVVAGPPTANAPSPQVVAATYSNPTRPYYGNPSVAATAIARMSTNAAEQPSTSGLATAPHLTGSAAEPAVAQHVVVSMSQESQPVPAGENPILAAHQAVATVVAEEIVARPASEPRRYVCGAPEQGRISTAPEFVSRCETVTTTCTTVPEPPAPNGPPVEIVTSVAEQEYGLVHIPESRSLQNLQAQQLTGSAQPGPSSGLDFLATAVTLLAHPVPSHSAPAESPNDGGNGTLQTRVVEAMDTTEPPAGSDVRLLAPTSNGADIRYASAPAMAKPDGMALVDPHQQAPPTARLDAGFRPAPNCNADVLAALAANFQQIIPPQQLILPVQAVEAAAQLNAPLGLRPDAFSLLAQSAGAPAPMPSATSDLPPMPPVAANTTVESSSGPPQ